MNTKLYLVSTGSYSDYTVLGIYSSKELANEAIIRFNAGSEAQEFTLDAMPERPPGKLYYHLDMFFNGDVRFIALSSMEDALMTTTYYIQPYTVEGKKLIAFKIWADDEKHAIKSANEIRTQLIAENKL